MNFVWAKNEVASYSVTLYASNITLNKAACAPFEQVRYVLIGYDLDNRQLAIKPVSKEEIDLGLYPKTNLHKLSLGKSYGRISNKSFMKNLQDLFELNYEKDKGLKLDAIFDKEQNMLIVQL